MSENQKRKICVIVASRANYGRVKYVLKAIQERDDLELQLIVGASALLYRFGKVIDIIKEDGFKPVRSIYYIVEGETLTTQAKSTGLGIVELSTAFEDLKPDLVVTVADRFETLSTAVAASYMNIPLAHIQGGEISGNIDESVRHAITKLSHFHFPSTKQSAERLLRMGEEEDRVFCLGCPSIDVLKNQDLSLSKDVFNRYGGVGSGIDATKPYILVMQHPVTSSYGDGLKQITETLEAVKNRPEQKIVLWPNIDAGTDDVSKGIRLFREKNSHLNFHFYRNFTPEDFGKILNNAACAVGNSSSFLREGAFLGVPSVLVGNRQNGREHGPNTVTVDYNRKQIEKAIDTQISRGRFEQSNIFGNGTAGEKIASKLSEIKLSINKKMTY